VRFVVYRFVYDPRIEIEVPVLTKPLDSFSKEDLDSFYEQAQMISAKIPAKIQELDKRYMAKYDMLHDHPELFFEIMDELNEISGKISELNVWFLHLEGRFIQTDGHF
jgi:hypothetical protein